MDGALTLLEPKTDRSRRIVMLPEAVTAALRTHRMERLVAWSRWVDSGHVFTTTVGTPIPCGNSDEDVSGGTGSSGANPPAFP